MNEVRRSHAGRRAAVLATAAVLLISCTQAARRPYSPAPTRSPRQRTDLVTLVPDLRDPPFRAIESNVLTGFGAEIPLTGSVSGGLMGWLAPVAVPSPDGRTVAYNSWGGLTPSVRLVDLRSGRDTLLAKGAFSSAWRRDGEFAYFKGVTSRSTPDEPYLGNIVVAASIDERPTEWTTSPDRYIVVGWAGSTLLAYRETEGEELELLALDGPGDMRSLGKRTTLTAISPDGKEILASREGAYPPAAVLLDVRSGHVLAKLDLYAASRPHGPFIHFLGYAGSWQGDHVVADTNFGLVTIQVRGSSLAVDEILEFAHSIPPHEPQFTPSDPNVVTAWIPTEGSNSRTYGYIEFSLDTRVCHTGDVSPETSVFFRVYNPSRPAPEVIAG